jgi:glutamyl-tRNA reductase
MKPRDGEKYEEWLERARMYEHGVALQKIAQGNDPEEVMKEMSRRLMEKALHPIFKAIRESAGSDYDPEKSRKEYEEKYLKDHKPVADHVEGNLFDKQG